MNGNVKTLKKERGFGFIKGDDGREYFFHVSGMNEKGEFDHLQEGDPVSFDVDTEATRGLRAKDIERRVDGD
jgi:CspA family cold shock protein